MDKGVGWGVREGSVKGGSAVVTFTDGSLGGGFRRLIPFTNIRKHPRVFFAFSGKYDTLKGLG